MKVALPSRICFLPHFLLLHSFGSSSAVGAEAPLLHLPAPVILRRIPETLQLVLPRLEFEVPAGKVPLRVSARSTRMDFRVPAGPLTLRVLEQDSRRMLLELRGKITRMECGIDGIELSAPKGILDRPFSLSMDSAGISLRGADAALRLHALLEITLQPEGLRSQVRNASLAFPVSPGTEPVVALGRIRVDGEDLRPSLLRELLVAMAPRIFRAQQARLEAHLAKRLGDTLQKKLDSVQHPFPVDLSRWIPGLELHNAVRRFPVSRTEEGRALQASLMTTASLEGRRIADAHGNAPSSADDQDEGTPERVPLPLEAGVLIPERFIQSLVILPELQRRIAALLIDANDHPGVSVLPAGIRVRMIHELQAASLLLPLEIDLIRTLNERSSPGERLRITLGDWIESWFGSGRSVHIPVEILVLPRLSEGRLRLDLRLPFNAAGEYRAPEHCAPEICPSNVERMSRRVRRGLMRTLHARFREEVPETVDLPAGILKTIKITEKNSIWLGTDGT
jgi:hypothetical protein